MRIKVATLLMTWALAVPAHAGSATYTYDALGRLIRVVYSSSQVNAHYDFDATGNLQNLVIATPPSVPPVVTGSTIGAGSVTFTFTPPSVYTGAVITGYVASCGPGGLTASVSASATSVMVTGLVKGTSYTCTVTANSAVGLGPSSPSIAIVGGAQTIAFGTVPLWIEVNRSVPATASSGLPVTLTSTTPSICTVVSGTTVRGLQTGSCTLTATQAGNASFLAATPVTRTLPVNRIAVLIGIIFGTDE